MYGLYAWYDEDRDTFPVILSLPAPPHGFDQVPVANPDPYVGDWDESAENAYDPKVVYAINFDRDLTALGDGVARASRTVYARFGYDRSSRTWGLRLEGLPGESGTVDVPVGVDVERPSGVKIRAGLFDDPFFFDLDGFFRALEPRGDPAAFLQFDSTHDTIAGRNSRCIVLELPRHLMVDGFWGVLTGKFIGQNYLGVWATSARLP